MAEARSPQARFYSDHSREERVELHTRPPWWHSALWVGVHAVGGYAVGAFEAFGFPYFASVILTGPVIAGCQTAVLRAILGNKRFLWGWAVATIIGWILGVIIESATPLSGNVAKLLGQVGFQQAFWMAIVAHLFWITFAATGQGLALVYLDSMPWTAMLSWLFVSWLGAAMDGAVSAGLCFVACSKLSRLFRGLIDAVGLGTYAFVTSLPVLILTSDAPATFIVQTETAVLPPGANGRPVVT